MQEQTPEALRRLARDMAKKINAELIRLSNVLLVIHSNRYWEDWGYASWSDYARTEVGMPPGASYNLLRIARWTAQHRPTRSQREALASLGRVKAYLIARVAVKADAEKWMEVARSMTAEQLRTRIVTNGKSEAKHFGFRLNLTQQRKLARAFRILRSRYSDPDDATQAMLLADLCDDLIESEKRAKRAAAG